MYISACFPSPSKKEGICSAVFTSSNPTSNSVSLNILHNYDRYVRQSYSCAPLNADLFAIFSRNFSVFEITMRRRFDEVDETCDVDAGGLF